MKKVVVICIVIVCILAMCGFGFNKQFFDTTYKFDKAIIALPDGSIVSGKVESWTDFEDGDQLQIKVDGKTYLAHATNCVLIAG